MWDSAHTEAQGIEEQYNMTKTTTMVEVQPRNHEDIAVLTVKPSVQAGVATGPTQITHCNAGRTMKHLPHTLGVKGS